MSACPPSMSVAAGAAPLYGMTTMSSGPDPKQLPGQVCQSSRRSAEIQLAGIAARIGDEFRQRLGRHRRADNECERRAGEHRNRDKVLERVVTYILGKQGTGHERGHTADHQGVTVR